MPKRARDSVVDADLAEIAAWHQWFVSAHTQRLADSNLPPDQHARELADVVRIAMAIHQRMVDDYLVRRRS